MIRPWITLPIAKRAVIRFQQGCGENVHPVEKLKIAILHGEHRRLIYDAAQRLSTRPLIHDLAA